MSKRACHRHRQPCNCCSAGCRATRRPPDKGDQPAAESAVGLDLHSCVLLPSNDLTEAVVAYVPLYLLNQNDTQSGCARRRTSACAAHSAYCPSPHSSRASHDYSRGGAVAVPQTCRRRSPYSLTAATWTRPPPRATHTGRSAC